MNPMMNDDLKTLLLSEDIEVQVQAIHRAVDEVQEILEAALRGILKSEAPIVATEVLAKFGPILIEPLRKQMKQESSHEASLAMAYLLLYLGEKEGVPRLMEELRVRGKDRWLAITGLAKAGVREAGPEIVECLREFVQTSDLGWSDQPKLSKLLSALEQLEVPVPEDVAMRLTAPGVPKIISGILTGD